MIRHEGRDSERVYERQLPGGGFVAIEVIPFRSLLGQRKYHGEVVVERRILRERRQGHEAPAVAEADAATVSSLFHELFPVAHSNVAVANCCLAREPLSYQSAGIAHHLARTPLRVRAPEQGSK